MNNLLANLLIQLALRLRETTEKLRDEEITVEQWQSEILRLLAQYLALAYMRGQEFNDLDPAQEQYVANLLREQSQYLENFAKEIRATGWLDKYLARAESYADSIRPPFWKGATECLNLPIRPADPRLDCGAFCKCFLEIRWLDKENCSADVYWRTTTVEHSPDCTRLEQQWSPLRVRNGIIQNG